MPAASLSNRYWVLRHGRSLANEARVIVSAPARGERDEWALAPRGREQARAAGEALRDALRAREATAAAPVFYTSPFSRARETAALAAAALPAAEVSLAPGLRERYFGDGLEGESDARYAEVWAADAEDAETVGDDPARANGESVMAVAARVGAVVDLAEAEHARADVVLVAHGDTLQIAQLVLAARLAGRAGPTPDEARRHREYGMQTGELREVGGG